MKRVWLAGLLLLGIVAGCQTGARRFEPYATPAAAVTDLVAAQATNRIDPAWLKPPEHPFTLGPGDRIDIEILGDGNGPQAVTVGPDGRIYVSLLPGQQVWGKTLAETKDLLERELAKFLRTPKVAITLRGVESKRVWIMGRLNTPGIYTLDAPMTLVEAISKAGGLFTSRFTGTTEELADLHHSFIIRRGQYLPIDFNQLIREGDTSQNVYLEPDDFVYLPSALTGEVYILGAVFQPRAVGYKDQLTLVSAIANARGTLPKAFLHHVAIIRGSLSQPSIAVVDYVDIITGQRPDVRLQPRDIVYVPFEPYRTLDKYANLILNTFVRTMAANEGSHAANPSASQVGVSLGVGQ
jgi:protein involved in polysaccharide export with SLBB domain